MTSRRGFLGALFALPLAPTAVPSWYRNLMSRQTAIGTPLIPGPLVARIHPGEMVVPACSVTRIRKTKRAICHALFRPCGEFCEVCLTRAARRLANIRYVLR